MTNELMAKTVERIMPERFESREEYLIYLRHLFAYEFAKDKISKNDSILEVGCGEGYGTNFLSKNAAKIIGLDVDKNTIEHAAKKYGSKNCTFETYNGVKIPYEDGVFDAVISFQAIEHIKADANYVFEIYRVLRKDGIYIVTTPNRTYRLKPGQKPWNKFHIREYYAHELENLLKTKFSEAKVWGIRGSDEAQKIEIERVKPNMDALSFNFLNYFKKLIPKPLKRVISDISGKAACKKQENKDEQDFLAKYSLKDFYAIENNIDDSLDLLGICTK